MRPAPKFKVGDWVQIWAGPNQDLVGAVQSIHWDADSRWHEPGWKYSLGWSLGVHLESNLTEPRRNTHYDRDGYCDNPARGY